MLINIEEHQPVAQWLNEGLISKDGKLFKPEHFKKKPNYPVLFSLTQTPQAMLAIYKSLQRSVQAQGLKITQVYDLPGSDWLVELNHKTKIVTPAQQKKFVDGVVYLQQWRAKHADQWPRRIDLRYSGQMAVRR